MMLSQQELIKAWEEATKEVIGANPEAYHEKLKWLEDKWRDEPDSEEVRILTPIVRNHGLPIRPIDIAIVVDNLDYFQKNYQESNDFHVRMDLARACLCGARQIGEFLLKKLNLDKLSAETEPTYEQLFGYVCLSSNTQWKKDLSLAMAQANMKMPSTVYNAGSFELFTEICEIFQKNTPSTPKSKPI